MIGGMRRSRSTAQAHKDLSQFFTRSGAVELTPQQLETLRPLGYIR